MPRASRRRRAPAMSAPPRREAAVSARAIPGESEIVAQFRAALEARGIIPPAELIADGALHRCDAAGRNGKADAAYILHLDGIPAGGFQNHRDGRGWEDWRADVGRLATPAGVPDSREISNIQWLTRLSERIEAKGLFGLLAHRERGR